MTTGTTNPISGHRHPSPIVMNTSGKRLHCTTALALLPPLLAAIFVTYHFQSSAPTTRPYFTRNDRLPPPPLRGFQPCWKREMESGLPIEM
jgi:hypothetical protein